MITAALLVGMPPLTRVSIWKIMCYNGLIPKATSSTWREMVTEANTPPDAAGGKATCH
jgi:hypothetical protein